MMQFDVERGDSGTSGAAWEHPVAMQHILCSSGGGPSSVARALPVDQIGPLARRRIGDAAFRQSEPHLLPSIGGAPRAGRRITGPIQFVIRLLRWWKLGRDDAVSLLGFRQGDAADVNAMLCGSLPLRGDDAGSRIAHLFRIRAILSSLFRDLEVENQWLREAHELLDGRCPLSLMLGSTEDLLLAKEYTETLAGL